MNEEGLRKALGKAAPKKAATPQTFDAKTESEDPALDQWVSDMTDLTRARVDAMLQVPGHVLVVDPENLDETVIRTSAEVFTQQRILARMRKKEYEAKRHIKRTEAKVYLEIIDFYKQAEAKLPSIEDRKAERDADQRVQDAHEEYAKILEHTLAVEALVEALKLKASFLPGLQGQQNNMQRFG